MTEKRKRIKTTLPKTLLIQIIETTPDGESVEDTFNLLLRKGLQSEGKLEADHNHKLRNHPP